MVESLENFRAGRRACGLTTIGEKIEPIWETIDLPLAGRIVLVWLRNFSLPFCGCLAYLKNGQHPYWVIYRKNSVSSGHDVVAWCDCLPSEGPECANDDLYERAQAKEKA